MRYPGIEVEIEEGRAYLQLDCPNTLNQLRPDLLESFARAFDEIAARGDVLSIVLGGRGKAFLAGVDLRWILARMQANDLKSILEFVRRGQAFFERIASCPKPVILRLDGIALGAGCELACCCPHVLALGARGNVPGPTVARLGFPETGIGIVPALGGSQRLPRRVGLPLARWMILCGEIVPAPIAHAMGLVTEVGDAATLESSIRRIHRGRPASESSTTAERKKMDPKLAILSRLFSLSSLDELLELPLPELAALASAWDASEKQRMRIVRRVRHQLLARPRDVLERADALLACSMKISLRDGLQEEVESLPAIFESAETLRRIRRALSSSAPRLRD